MAAPALLRIVHVLKVPQLAPVGLRIADDNLEFVAAALQAQRFGAVEGRARIWRARSASVMPRVRAAGLSFSLISCLPRA